MTFSPRSLVASGLAAAALCALALVPAASASAAPATSPDATAQSRLEGELVLTDGGRFGSVVIEWGVKPVAPAGITQTLDEATLVAKKVTVPAVGTQGRVMADGKCLTDAIFVYEFHDCREGTAQKRFTTVRNDDGTITLGYSPFQGLDLVVGYEQGKGFILSNDRQPGRVQTFVDMFREPVRG